MEERPVQFRANGETVCGILHLPEGSRNADFGFVFVHSGSRGRRGNTFQYPMYARHFAARGYPSLRFDPIGFGDTTGEIETCHADDFYGSIQLGRFVDDTVAGVEEFLRHVNPRKLVLFGICGGAITGLIAAPKLKRRVDGLVLMSIPVLIDSSGQDELARIPKDYARKYLISMYARKLLSLTAWKRLLLGRSDTGTIFTMLKATLLGQSKKKHTPPPEEGEGTRFNRHFVESLNTMVKGRSQVIFLFGDDDTFRWEFEREFYNNHWDDNPGYSRNCVVHYLPGCNHMFTMREWQNQALDLIGPWLQKL
jgi:pimeloyl-ACP methyl ester carboxylesterase